MREPRERLLVGIDENGLGPRLGPMTVTAVMLNVRAGDPSYSIAAANAGIGDSKSLCAHGSMRQVESLVLALLELHLGASASSLTEFLGLINLHDEAWMRAPCPDTQAPVACFGAEVTLPAYGPGITPEARSRAASLIASGVTLRAVSAASVCARRLNNAHSEGKSRFDLDLDAMISLMAFMRSRAPQDLSVVCGKVGGRKSYESALSKTFLEVSALERSPQRSAYYIPNIGSVAFVQDADASHPAVSLASLFGKYLRELSMERQHRYYASVIPSLGRASGYHDPVTARFVAATKALRSTQDIAARCFER